MLSLYRAVMDPSINPLRNAPPAQRFQLMLYLSIMWTTIFCAAALLMLDSHPSADRNGMYSPNGTSLVLV